MLKVKTDVIKPQIDKDVISRNAYLLADNIGTIIRGAIRERLTFTKKVVTRKTIGSIKTERILSSASRGIFIRHVTGAKSFIFVQMGRRAGAKMPVYKKGNKFVPFPELAAWFRKLGIPKERWFLIMRAIARRGIRPTDVRDASVAISQVRIQIRAAQIGRKIAREFFKK
jgi:hypothetical protein